MGCKDWEQKIAQYLDGFLPPEEAAAVDRHLQECESCRALYDQLLKDDGALSGFVEGQLNPPRFKDKVWKAIQREKVVHNEAGLWARLTQVFGDKKLLPSTHFIGAIAVLILIVISAWCFWAITGNQFLGSLFGSKPTIIKSDTRMLAIPIESYYVDRGLYPAWTRSKSQPKLNHIFPTPAPEVGKKIIQEANLRLEVESVSMALQKLTDLVLLASGYITNSRSESRQHIAATGYLTARVPAQGFPEFLNNARNVGEVLSEQLSGKDVTTEFIDAQSRLRTLKVEETRLLEMTKKMGSLDELLRVERELTRMRNEIERTQGRMNYINNRAEFVTVSLELTEKLKETPIVKGMKWSMLEPLKSATGTFVEVLRICYIGLVWGLVLLPFPAAAIFLVTLIIKLLPRVSPGPQQP